MSGFGAFLGGLSGGTIGASVVSLILDTKRFDAGLVGARGRLTTATATMEGGVSKFAGVAKAGFALAAVGVAAFAAKAVSAASDQEEALNKSKVVFGQASAAVESFAETSAESFAISKTAALSAAAGFGNMLLTAGLTESAAADMSVSLVKLAADMASFNNIDPTEALEKLRSGLAGEAEPLRVLGVQLSETRVKAEAYASGIAEVGAELTDQQKIQARYNIITQDTKKQQGDFARTSGSLANQQRILTAQVEDLAAALGKVLLPAVNAVIGVVNTALGPVVAFADALSNAEYHAHSFTRELRELAPVGVDSVETLRGIKEESQRAGESAFEYQQRLVQLRAEWRNGQEVAEGWAAKQKQVAAETEKAGDAARGTRRSFQQMAHLTEEGLKELREQAKDDLASIVGSVGGFQRKWQFTAQSFNNQVEGMRAKSRELRTTMEQFSRLKGIPAEFQAWLLQQGPDAIRAFVQNSAAGRQDIISDWRAIDRNTEASKRKIDDVTSAVRRVGDGIRNLDGKTAEVTVRLRLEADPRIPDSLIDDALSDALVRGQTSG